jgi:hypothetical protein
VTSRHRWPAGVVPDELGVVVHGPVVLARSPGIAVGLRCVFAHPDGLHLPLVLRARDLQAEAASRWSFPRGRRDDGPATGSEPWSGLRLGIELNGRAGSVDAGRTTSSGGADTFGSEASYWVGELPGDGRLRLTVGWPQAGLAEASTGLQLDGLQDLGDRVLPLP